VLSIFSPKDIIIESYPYMTRFVAMGRNWYKKAQGYAPNTAYGEHDVEEVVFLQGEEAAEPLRILQERGEQAALEYLKQWHYPGEHMTRSGFGHGTSDETYEEGPYVMSYNLPLGYIGLQAKMDDVTDEATSSSFVDQT